MPDSLTHLPPVPTLLRRARDELSAEFDFGRAMRVSRAPGRLDVMGGIGDYTGSMVCELTLDRAAAVLLQERSDRQLQIFSFNLFDEHKPFTFRMPIDALAEHDAQTLRREFNEPGRNWAAYVAGCLHVLSSAGFVDLRNPGMHGLNIALLSDVPMGAGVSSSAAITVATMMGLRDQFDLMNPLAGRSLRIANETALNPLKLAELCQRVENRVVGAPCGIMDHVSSVWGEEGKLMRMVCQPHELLPPLLAPEGVRFVGIDSQVKHSVAGGAYEQTRCAAFMAHKMILEQMRQMGATVGRRLVRDPMNGYLANLDPDDYKRIFRPSLPEQMQGSAFIEQFKTTIDRATSVQAEVSYAVQGSADHHVLEARRVKNFATFLEEAASHTDPAKRGFALDRAGHLMYASHHSYMNDAMLGSAQCDLLVKLVRQHERAGLYGARMTGGGSGGTVAVLADVSERADDAIAQIMSLYEKQTGLGPELFAASSPGAWHVGTTALTPRESW